MINSILLNKTAKDSIAIWTPLTGNISAGLDFIKPIILSSGVGVDNFINIDPPPIKVIQRIGMNGAPWSSVRKVMLSGSATFNPSSTALISLRNILAYQNSNNISVSGIMIIINAGALLMDTYRNFEWTSPYQGANRNRVLSDITLTFSCSPPQAISLGALGAILGQFTGVNI